MGLYSGGLIIGGAYFREGLLFGEMGGGAYYWNFTVHVVTILIGRESGASFLTNH